MNSHTTGSQDLCQDGPHLFTPARRNSLADRLVAEAKALADLKIDKAAVEGERRTVDADLGPVRYLTALFGQADYLVLRWFILAVALLLDLAAVLLRHADRSGVRSRL